MNDVVLARAVHVLSLVHWIGGVAFVTLVALPLANSRGGAEGWALLHAVERRFSAQVRWSIALAGASGAWMTYRMGVAYRFSDPQFWWMDAMVGLWLLFAAIVFVVEPLLHRRIERLAAADAAAIMGWMTRGHAVLLSLAAVTVLGAVAGAQGVNLF
jgi:uncharacterized membrane protein